MLYTAPPAPSVRPQHIRPVPSRVYPLQPARELAIQVADVAQHLLVARARLAVAGERGVVGHVASALLPHQGVLPLLGLGELGGDDHEAQVDHEERPHLARRDVKLQFEPSKCSVKIQDGWFVD